MEPTRDAALKLLDELGGPEATRRALGVEAAMRHIARTKGEDEDKWGIIGLIRSLKLGEESGQEAVADALRRRDWPVEYVQAVSANGWGIGWDADLAELMSETIPALESAGDGQGVSPD